jgi:uncharacterized spore protein YtfJ
MAEQRGAGPTVIDAIAQTLETNTSRKVFGEPVTVGDVTVIPAAKVSGGGGGGGGSGADGRRASEGGTGEGTGAGVGQSAKPMGAFVLRQDKVTWRPAVDVNRIIMGAQIVAIVALLTVRALLRRRRF